MRPNIAGNNEWERRGAPLDDRAMEQHIRAIAVSMNTDGNATVCFPTNGALHMPQSVIQLLVRENERLPVGMEWLADNGRLAETMMKSLCHSGGERLPAIRRMARIQHIMQILVRHSDGLVSTERLTRCLVAFDEVRTLSMKEIWAAPSALAAALSNEYLKTAADVTDAQKDRQAADEWIEADAKVSAVLSRRSAAFFERALESLKEREMFMKYEELMRWLLERDRSAEQIIALEHERQAHACLLMGNILSSLRMLDSMDWSEQFEKISRTEQALLADPAGTYPLMDDESRTQVRDRVTLLAKFFGMGEETVARCALEAAGEHGEISREITWWLYTDAGGEALKKRMGIQRRIPRISPDPTGKGYMTAVIGLAAAILCAALALWKWRALFGIPLWWGAAAAAINAAALRIVRPKPLMKLQMERVPDEYRTLVVMPALLSTPARTRELTCQLEALGCLENDDNISFLLLGDLVDHDKPAWDADMDIIEAANQAINEANARAGREKYYFLYRKRTYQASERRFMGHERKRGALNALNRLLISGENAFCQDDASRLFGRFSFVLTLDAGARTLPGTIRKMIGAMAHPVNRRHREPNGKEGGYALLVPRVELPADAVMNRFVRLLGGTGGVDSYPTAVSDVYQDLCGQGVFGGKGIYDIAAFEEALCGKLPDNAILSHDMIEGILAGAGFLSDLALYEGFPKTAYSYQMRQHRWIRGDWQLTRLLFDRRLALKGLDVYRIFDNLRRSMEPVAQMILLYAGFYAHSWTLLLVGFTPWLIPMILYPNWTKERWQRIGVRLIMLPQDAFTALSAILTALWRMIVTHRKLLQWVTADDAERRGGNLSTAPGWTAAVLLLPAMIAPTSWLLADVLLAALWWTSASFFRELEKPVEEAELDLEEKERIMDLATRTFRFFSENTSDTGLTPDNVQLDPPTGAAMRTSPTNIGLYLAACVSAREIGLISGEELARRASQTLNSLEKMEKWNGQPYNWYHPKTLEALLPRYVSSVDSGNMAASLLLCARELELDGSMDLATRMEKFVRNMNFSCLFDQRRKLFFIGMDVENGRMSAAHYDLLASESRILSFTAMMLGQIPVSHWNHLGRAVTQAGRSAALISWSGTMFEYLMPDLFLPVYRGTLLHQTQQAVICAQQEAGIQTAAGDNLWGVSESGYYAFDPAMNYQYRAFGLPSLALRGDAGDQVVAPYASVLALPFHPETVMENLEKMMNMGLMDEQGFFEAADYSKKRLTDGRNMHVVKSHMAHHQGMILCALCNALTGNVLVRRFIDRPEARALTLLLQEKPAVRVRLTARGETNEPVVRRPTPFRGQRMGRNESAVPDAHLLSGCGTTMLLCADGSGFVARDGVLMNRRETDTALSPQGLFVHAHDVSTGRRVLLSGMGNKGEGVVSTMQFDAGNALSTVQTDRFASALRTLISPEDGACLQQIVLTNRTNSPVEMDITACFQVALARERDYVAHPAFQNLFIESSLEAAGTLCFRRRVRAADEKNMLLIHSVAGVDVGNISWETDLFRLIGREGRISDPYSMKPSLDGTLGHVLTPCSALRVQINLPAQGRKSVCFAAGLVHEEEKKAFVERHASLQTASRALKLAAAQGREMIRYLHLTPGDYHQLQRGSALLLYPRLRGCSAREISRREANIRQLWPMGISGDVPILLAVVVRPEQMEAVREIVRAHEFYRMMGVESDLILLYEQENDYAQPLRDRLNRLIAGSHLVGLIGQKSGVHMVDAKELSDEQRALLREAACMTVSETDGRLSSSIRSALMHLEPARPLEEIEPSAPLSVPSLQIDNGWGGFSEDGYTIYRIPTPAPWCNILCNREMGSMVSERGGGFIWYMNSRNGRLTPFDNDPLSEGWGDVLLLKEGGKTWSPAGKAGRITHRPGASVYEGEAEKFAWRLVQFVDLEMPVKCHLVELTAKEDVCLTVQARMDWLMQVTRAEGGLTQTGYLDGAWWARGGIGAIGFACANYMDMHMEAGRMTGNIVMRGGEKKRFEWMIGAVRDEEEMRSLRVHWRDVGGGERRYLDTLAFWQERLGRICIHTPDELINRMVNEFLPYQTLCSRVWGRAGFYQAGGAFGFRDQLQDMLAMLFTDPEMVRNHIVLCARHQFQAGDVQHWWHPDYEGVRTRISDDMLFLPYVTAEYVSATQDLDVLNWSIPFLKDVEIPAGKEDYYGTAELSEEVGSLHEHCLRAIRRACRVGKNGLLLMGAGDWNDGMNRVGCKGEGESVWLTEFMIVTLEKYAPLCEKETQEELVGLAGKLREAIERNGWDGRWYVRAYMDDGTVLGSASSEGGCRIDSLAQSWAALAGLSRERVKTALNEADRQLIDREHDVIRLLTPPFDGDTPDPGYIRGYPPGVRENGGQYTHAACWLVIALAEMGMGNQAWEAFRMLMPWTHSDTKEKAEIYRVEPYVIAADVYGEPPLEGRGGWTWYTGAAGWMIRAAYAHLLGYERKGEFASLHAILPDEWNEISMTLRIGSAEYTLSAQRDCGAPLIDGQPMPPSGVRLTDDGKKHVAMFPIRKGIEKA